ncbi:hypothetical protein EI94DRAFT_1810354 [Lactarius quietus]|nr:hypothetical protein EI94DRAFT_1810354 [Lactarius quietus]
MKYYYVKSARGGHGGRVAVAASIWACKRGGPSATTQAAKTKAQPKAAAASTPKPALVKPMTSITTEPPARTSEAKAEEDDASPRMQYALFGLHVAAAATPSSPALSSSIATPVLSSTAHPHGARARAAPHTPCLPRRCWRLLRYPLSPRHLCPGHRQRRNPSLGPLLLRTGGRAREWLGPKCGYCVWASAVA